MEISEEPGLCSPFPQSWASTFKRRRSSSENSTDTLQPDAYTIGWISALPIEMTAAEVMLDHIHNAPSHQLHDSNCYIFGSVGLHNIVIACLPSGHYGTNNAATVATHMSQSFPNIHHRLMVGIGGGAPGLADVRLGDVVVSNDVIQYDLGKAMPDSKFERTAYPVRPPQSLLTAVARLRASHGGGSVQMSETLQQSISRLPAFARPTLPDRLFISSYDHPSSAKSCDSCDQQQLVLRDPRQTLDPVILYGRIASGNQVIKYGLTRDKLSQELGSICFEMEAAGLMHNFPCLVIRGICDYSDSHKNKNWQQYTALVAAAYAKDLLLTIPSQSTPRYKKSKPSQSKAAEPIDPDTVKCLQELFVTDPSQDREDILDAKGDICQGTCEWILSTQELKMWKENSPHLLWISAPPGMGKTFLSIYLSKHFETMCKDQTDTAAIFFFCDNKVANRNTAVNILRGLLTQLVSHQKDLANMIMAEWRQKSSQLFQDSSLNTLWKVFQDMIRASNFHTIYCIIDALDECEGNSLTILLKKFKRLSQSSTTSSTKLKLICLSRRFPERIPESLDSFIKVELDMMTAGKEDVRRFISERISDLSRTKKFTSRIRKRVEEVFQEKSEGTFLWVSFMAQDLVEKPLLDIIPSLNRLPSGLDAVYDRILTQINFNKREVIRKMLDWILIATRPLRIPELCEAAGVKATDSMCRESVCVELIRACGHLLLVEYHNQETDYDIGWIIRHMREERHKIARPETEPETQLMSDQGIAFWSTQVTFLHQSAKDYYITLKQKGNSEKPENLLQSLHESTASQLIGYFSHIGSRWSYSIKKREKHKLFSYLPLALYASGDWYTHFRQLEELTRIVEENEDFFSEESKTRRIWERLSPFLGIYNAPYSGFPLLHMSCVLNLGNLATWCLTREETSDLNKTWGLSQQTPLHLACSRGYETIINMLLDAGADALATDDQDRSAIYRAIQVCNLNTLRKMTLRESYKGWMKQEANDPRSGLLSEAAIYGKEDVCRFLVEEHSFDVNITDESGFPPVMCALRGRHFDLVCTFVHEWKAHFDHWKTLDMCSKEPDLGRALELITHVVHHCKVDINTTDRSGNNILWTIFKQHVDRDGILALLHGLVELGLSIDRTNSQGQTPLHCACLSAPVALSYNFMAVVEFIMGHSQLDINKTDQDGKTALHYFISARIEPARHFHDFRYPENVPKSLVGLLDLGVDRHANDLDGRLALCCLRDTAKTLRPKAEQINQKEEEYVLVIKRMIVLLENYQTVPTRIRR
jgi:nucleoside phosphorylase/ankyrin repeat protein/Cdc6-like AAA superfamily ATPase